LLIYFILLLGRQEAKVSDGAVGCTFEFKRHETDSFVLFDTVGLSEGSKKLFLLQYIPRHVKSAIINGLQTFLKGKGTVTQSFAVRELIKLLKSLENGVSLLTFVMKKGRIMKSLDENYKLFVDGICMRNVPEVLAISHCEMDKEPKQWFSENKQHLINTGN